MSKYCKRALFKWLRVRVDIGRGEIHDSSPNGNQQCNAHPPPRWIMGASHGTGTPLPDFFDIGGLISKYKFKLVHIDIT